MAGDVVRVLNHGDREFVGGYDQQRYVVPAGGQSIVPRDAAQHWTGRWHTFDREHHKERTVEYERLMVLYGIFADETTSIEEKMETNIPKLEVTDLDGNKIVTVLEDPHNDFARPADTTQVEKDLLEQQIAKMQRELSSLTSALAMTQTNKDGKYEPSIDVVPTDDPKKVPVTDGPRRGRTATGS